MSRVGSWPGLWVALAAAAALADPPDEDELARLPPPTPKPAVDAPPVSALRGKAFVENALTGWAVRDPLAVPSPQAQPRYQDRLSFDGDLVWQPAEQWKLHVSDRFNGYLGEGLSFPSRANLRNDLRELSAAVEPLPRLFVDAGRINLRSGVALGFNPTDFFRPRTQVDLASIDPSVQRENRLGVFLVRAQWIREGAALALAFAPALQAASPLASAPPASFDLRLGNTNAQHRLLATVSFDLLQLNPQALAFLDEGGLHLGVGLSRLLGDTVVLYAEWAGAVGDDLSARAVTFGKSTGTLPAGAPQLPQASARHGWQSDIAAGFSWTSAFKLTVNAEYHFHQAGLTGDDFDRWSALGGAGAPAATELWYVRQFAADQGEPLARHQLFLRADWPDWFVTNLAFEAVLFAIPADRSTLAQLSVRYFASREWTLALHSTLALGAATSVQGTLPFWGSEVFQLARYF